MYRPETEDDKSCIFLEELILNKHVLDDTKSYYRKRSKYELIATIIFIILFALLVTPLKIVVAIIYLIVIYTLPKVSVAEYSADTGEQPFDVSRSVWKEYVKKHDFASFNKFKKQTVTLKPEFKQRTTETNLKDNDNVNENNTSVEPAPQKNKKQWYKRWWVLVISVLAIIFIFAGLNSSGADPDNVASDVKTTLQQSNSLDVVSVKADKDSRTIIVKVKENKSIARLYEGYPSGFKSVQRDLVDLSKKYADEDNDDFDLSYIQLIKPGTNNKILLSVDKGKVKYTVLDDLK